VRPPTVLLLTPFFSPNVGGVETRFDNITEYLDRHGYRVWVLTYQPVVTQGVRGAPYERRGERTEIWRLAWPGGDWFHRLLDKPLLCALYLCPGLLWKGFWFLLRRRREVDVIHAPGFNAALVARLLRAVFRVPYVVSMHALYGFRPGSLAQAWARWTLRKSRRVLALSEKSRQDVLSVGLPPAQVSVHTNWIDVNRFRPVDREASKRALGLEGKFVVVMVGRLKRIKGVDLVLELARNLDLEDVRVVVAGDGDMADAVSAEAQRNPRLVFLGRIANCDLPAIYNAADVSLVPSVYPEGFSRVVLETLCCGVPLVASKVGCIPEEVDDTCSILVEPTTDAFQKAVLTLYHDRDRRDRMAIAARAYGEARYSEKNMATVLDAYDFPLPSGTTT
jgi:glycosyltransferase involved in cell wall biosynthesis